ncbi:hypothetical protein M501DRAFT_1013712 [Patellaria atrata CBS 101060]|uniref:Uncharacterized protein n=1 Tax=Patellaria atrata CBS 101060 TaxID=1346257 RepID=A0A9P4VQX7_9PEZI|nr:hypothetical protein M501DRAFT_1013712 [Patellaria atrata CBS 101060]
MLGITSTEKKSKCLFTTCTIPLSIDEKQPPAKKKPFSTILAHPFSHTVDLILSEEMYDLIHTHLNGDNVTLQYSRVFMSLSDILLGDFFNQYIKEGNVLMVSEGHPGVDNTFTLSNGILRLELDRATYERCGLVGTPIESGARKHTKSRYVIELNLRLPSMLHGKKGFERIVWACKNVLNHSLTWLFYDFDKGKDEKECPIMKHHPFERTVKVDCLRMKGIATPPLTNPHVPEDEVYVEQLYEWLGLVSLDSPRICINDGIDPYLSRYQVPDFQDDHEVDGRTNLMSKDLVRLRWHGLIPTDFILSLLLLTMQSVDEEWMALNVSCFGSKSYTILGTGSQEMMLWECP